MALALLVWSALIVACSESTAGRRGPRHLVLVVVDTLRADALIDPDDLVDTPNLDRFAREGVAFSRAFSHAPMTLPAHAAMFSSRLPAETGVLNNGQVVPRDLPLLGEHLAHNGFDVLGAYSLGTLRPGRGTGSSVDRGFVEFRCAGQVVDMAPASQVVERLDGMLERSGPSRARTSGAPRKFVFGHFSDPHQPYNDRAHTPSRARMVLDGELVSDQLTTSLWTEFSEELALAPGLHRMRFEADHLLLLRSFRVLCDGKPLDVDRSVLNEPLEEIEVSFEIPQGTKSTRVEFWLTDNVWGHVALPRYRSEVEYVDHWFGELSERLDEAGILEDCLLVFTSDHGEAFGEDGEWAHVQSVHEALIHVPLFFWTSERHRWLLDRLPPGGTGVSHLDLAPTILALMDLPALSGQRGRNLLESAEGFLHVAETHPPEARANILTLRDETRKLVYFADEDRFEMFLIEEDPGQLNDVFAERGAEVADWQQRLRRLAPEALTARSPDGKIPEDLLQRLRELGYFAQQQ